MSSATPSEPEPDPETTQKSRPSLDKDWMCEVSNQMMTNLINFNFGLDENPTYCRLPNETINAAVNKLIDSPEMQELMHQAIGEIWVESQLKQTEWNAELNQRRFEMIDKELQETISPEESAELAGLTQLMRNQIDTEENLPLKGAKELHSKLLEMDQKDEPQ